MFLNIRSLGIGISIGLVAAIVTTFYLIPQEYKIRYETDTNTFDQDVGLYIYGIVKEISADTLIVDQTFGMSDDKGNQAVKINIERETNLLWCDGNDSLLCEKISYDKVVRNSHVCLQAFLQKDGSFKGGKIFFNVTCTFKQP